MSTVSGGYQEWVQPFHYSRHHEFADIPGLKNVFDKSKATTAGSYVVEMTYISSKKKQRGIPGKKTRYCFKYRHMANK